MLDFTIETITCFLNNPLVVMLILGFFFLSLPFIAFIILPTLSADKDGKTSLIRKTFSILGKILDFETCTYDFLVFEDFGFFLLIVSFFLLRGGAIMLGGGEEMLNKAGVDADGDDFSFIILMLDFNKPGIALSLNKEARLLLTHFLIVSAFSLLNKRIFHLEVKITLMSFQRLLITGTKSPLDISLLVRRFLI